MRLTVVDSAPASRRGAGISGREFRPEEIAQLLERWRPDVLRRMRGRRLWRGTSAPDCEDQYQDVALVLCARQFRSEDHLRRALWTGLGFRARDFWKASRQRDLLVPDLFEERGADESSVDVEDAAATAADSRYVEDCLSELDAPERAVYRLVHGEGLSRRKTAKALDLTEAEVLRALHSAQLKVDRFALLFVSGRLCARRAGAVGALARAEASEADLAQARAHLSHCRDCLLSFRAHRAILGGRLASVLPLPAVAAESHGEALRGSMYDLAAAAKRHVYAWMGRAPRTSAGAEAVAGAGAGGVAATKIAVGLCVTAAAGGGAVCAETLGLFGTPPHPDSRAASTKHAHAKKHVVSSAPAVATHDPPPAPATSTTPRSSSAKANPQRSVRPKAQAALAQPSQPHQEFFDAPNGSGAAPAAKPAAVHSAASGSSSQGGGSSGSSSAGGGSEFFGG